MFTWYKEWKNKKDAIGAIKRQKDYDKWRAKQPPKTLAQELSEQICKNPELLHFKYISGGIRLFSYKVHFKGVEFKLTEDTIDNVHTLTLAENYDYFTKNEARDLGYTVKCFKDINEKRNAEKLLREGLGIV